MHIGFVIRVVMILCMFCVTVHPPLPFTLPCTVLSVYQVHGSVGFRAGDTLCSGSFNHGGLVLHTVHLVVWLKICESNELIEIG